MDDPTPSDARFPGEWYVKYEQRRRERVGMEITRLVEVIEVHGENAEVLRRGVLIPAKVELVRLINQRLEDQWTATM